MRIQTDSDAAHADLAALPQQQKVVLVMDLVESVRLMAGNERAVVDHWRGFVRHAQTDVLPKHRGRMVKSLGDGIMAEFDEPRQATNAAMALHRYFDGINLKLRPEQQYFLRAGLNAAQVYVDEQDIYGSGVNLAARVATLAGPGETMVTAEVRDGLTDGLDAQVEDMGECYLKHISEPIRVWRTSMCAANRSAKPKPNPQKSLVHQLLILPAGKRNLSRDAGALADVLHEGLVRSLSRHSELQVIDRPSSQALESANLAHDQLTELTGASFVVELVAVQRGGKLCVTFSLTELATLEILLDGGREFTASQLLEPQNTVASSVGEEVFRAIAHREGQRLALTPLPNLACASLLMGAVSAMYRNATKAFDLAGRAFETLAERHPRNASALTWLSTWHTLSVTQGFSSNVARSGAQALRYAGTALDLDESNSAALAILGISKTNLRFDFDGAAALLNRAKVADPSNAEAILYSSVNAAFAGYSGGLTNACASALALTPFNPLRHYHLTLAATAALGDGDYAESIDWALASLRGNARHASTYRTLALAQALAGKYADARQTIEQLRNLAPSYTVSVFAAQSGWAHGPKKETMIHALRESGLPA